MNIDETPLPGQDAVEPDPATSEPGTPEPADPQYPRPAKRSPGTWLAAAALVVGLAVLALQIVTLNAASDARDVAQDASNSATALSSDVGGMRVELGAITNAVDGLEEDLAAGALDATVGEGASSASEVAGPLPAYPESGPDPAVEAGLRVAPITGDEYYSGEQVTFAPDGEGATLWLVWAHWCPHCQTELPDLSEFWAASGDDYPHVELVTISTSIDESRGNPLMPYLDESQFPFPVLVDESGGLAATLGTTAFPFWVVTGPDGEVLFRRPGALGIEQVAGLVTSVEDFIAG